jgi:hypothetical protein
VVVVAVAEERGTRKRKEARRVRPLMSELQVPKWQELELGAGGGPAEVEKGDVGVGGKSAPGTGTRRVAYGGRSPAQGMHIGNTDADL